MSGILVGAASGYAPAGGGGGGTFNFYSPLTIDHTKVPSTQTDFPVLVSVTDNRFKTIANGGHVYYSSGSDIRPFSDNGLTTALTYELERYDASTGELVMWVKIPSLSNSVDTVIYLAYDNSLRVSSGSSASTWSNSYLGVYHLGNGTTLNVNSATGSNNGTNINAATAATGKVDGCASLVSASNQYINLGAGINPSSITYSAWVNATSFPNSANTFIAREDATGASVFDIFVSTGGKLQLFARGADAGDYHYVNTGSQTLSAGVWYYMNGYWDEVTGITGIYVNTTLDNFVSVTPGTLLRTSPAATTLIGNHPNATTLRWDGLIDEVQISSVARSANWITAAYNNQSSPGTFMTLGTEV